jgi:hypothetical protein
LSSGIYVPYLRLASLTAPSTTGAAGATINRLPVLLFPGDIYVTRFQGPVLQQLEHGLEGDVSVNDCFRPVSRYFDRISRPEQLLTALPEVLRGVGVAAGPIRMAINGVILLVVILFLPNGLVSLFGLRKAAQVSGPAKNLPEGV